MNTSAIPDETEVLTIGGGPGGYVSAIRTGQLGYDVTLVEKDAYGGTCLNHGCIPSKALISASNVVHDAEHAEQMGIQGTLSVDMASMVDWKDGIVGGMTLSVEKLCKANQVTLVDGLAQFEDDHHARVETDEATETVEFDHAIVATGSRPIEVPGFSFESDPVLSSRDALRLDSVPDSLVVVGAGYIGLELATVYAKLGTDVTVVEMLDDVLPAFDTEVSRPVKQRGESLGIDFNFGEAASEWRTTADGIEVLTQTKSGEESAYPTEHVLVAVGRSPVTETLGLDATSLEPTDDGFLETDERARTALEHIYAVGDVAGEPMLAHKASAEGQVAAESIAGQDSSLSDRAIPAAVYTDPEIGTVGLTEAAAVDRGYDPVIGEFPFHASGRALTVGETDGLVRLVANEDTGVVLGGQVVGPEASELIAEIGMAVTTGTTLEDLSRTIHAHPTLSEAVMEAAENALGHAIHTLNR